MSSPPSLASNSPLSFTYYSSVVVVFAASPLLKYPRSLSKKKSGRNIPQRNAFNGSIGGKEEFRARLPFNFLASCELLLLCAMFLLLELINFFCSSFFPALIHFFCCCCCYNPVVT
jgi:hypothetical protein